MTEFQQGLMVSLFGLLITFMALGLFILIMLVLQRLFPSKPEVEEAEVEPALIEAPVLAATDDEDEAIAAAIAAAVSYVKAQNQSGLGDALQEGRGAWWRASGQTRQR